MQEYCESLKKFERNTTVDVYLEAIEASDVLTSEFTKMTINGFILGETSQYVLQ